MKTIEKGSEECCGLCGSTEICKQKLPCYHHLDIFDNKNPMNQIQQQLDKSREEFDEFVEEKYWSTRVDPRLLKEEDVFEWHTQKNKALLEAVKEWAEEKSHLMTPLDASPSDFMIKDGIFRDIIKDLTNIINKM